MRRAIGKYATDFVAIIAMAVVAIAVGAYIILNQDARPALPFIEDTPVEMKAEFSDAQAVVPGQGQSVRIAGVQIGKISGVDVENGVAVVTMAIEPDYAARVHENASALLRPRTGLKDMFVELDPGTDESPRMAEGGRIPVENTAPDIDPDEILSALDTDTRAYLRLLVNGAGKGLENRGNDLREVFKRLEPLHRDLKSVNGALAQRRTQLARLISNYGDLTTELASSDSDLERLVSASNDTFGALASQDTNISRAVALLPGALNQTNTTLGKVDRLSQVLGPTLDQLRPAVRELDNANTEILPLVREGEPQLREEIRPFVKTARPYVSDFLKPASANLAEATPELSTSFLELNRFFNMLSFNPAGRDQELAKRPVSGSEPLTGDTGNGPDADRNRKEGYLFWLHWVATNGNSVFSTRDANGPYRRVLLQLSCKGISGQYENQLEAFREALPAPLKPLASQFTTATLALILGQDVTDNPLCPGL